MTGKLRVRFTALMLSLVMCMGIVIVQVESIDVRAWVAMSGTLPDSNVRYIDSSGDGITK